MAKTTTTKNVLTKSQLIKELNKIISESDKKLELIKRNLRQKNAVKLERLLKKNGYYYNSNPCCCVNADGTLCDNHGGMQLALDGRIAPDWNHFVMSGKTVLKSL